jgi:hypothetical protein
MKTNTPHIFADFHNADSKGRVRLNTRGTADDLAALQLQLCEGLKVVLYDGDEIEADGVVRSSIDGWVAEVDWEVIQKRLSPLEDLKS